MAERRRQLSERVLCFYCCVKIMCLPTCLVWGAWLWKQRAKYFHRKTGLSSSQTRMFLKLEKNKLLWPAVTHGVNKDLKLCLTQKMHSSKVTDTWVCGLWTRGVEGRMNFVMDRAQEKAEHLNVFHSQWLHTVLLHSPITRGGGVLPVLGPY